MQPVHSMRSQVDDDPELVSQQSRELCVRERRAFHRGFWWTGGLGTVPWLGTAMIEIWSNSQLIVLERLIYSILLALVGGPLGILLLGLGPGFFLMFWVNLFRDSIVVQEYPWRRLRT
jgi:hypothetical protein